MDDTLNEFLLCKILFPPPSTTVLLFLNFYNTHLMVSRSGEENWKCQESTNTEELELKYLNELRIIYVKTI